MMRRLGLLILALAGACSSDPKGPVVLQYAKNLDANYKDVITQLVVLKSQVDAFVAAPSAAGMLATQQAWLGARPSYGECEVSRFYGGPIDQAQGGMNEWPIDENFIDYTAGNPMGGIINDPTDYPQLTEQVLATADEKGGIENLSTGFHAIEFLLWGQRLAQTDGPGQRPYTDYVDGGGAPNPDRRRTYLQVATNKLLEDMKALDAQWDLTDPTSYGAKLVAGPTQDGIADMLRGFSNMAISELLYERLDDPYVTQDRKDEESCFSENTYVDINANALGVEDVYLGRYQMMQGPSISDLVKSKNPQLDATMRQQLTDIRTSIMAIPPPLDHAILAAPTSDANMKVQAAIAAFMPLESTIDQVGQLLDVKLDL
jgi:putative iron-regulated protein